MRKPTSPTSPARTLAPAKRQRSSRRPLPDAIAIYPVPVPQSEPPYDDGDPKPSRPARARARIVAADKGAAAGPGGASPDRTGGSRAQERLQAGQWPSQFAQVLAETLAGTRPPGHIAPWTTDQARRRIGQLGAVLATAHQPRVRRVVIRSPEEDVLEMAVVVVLGERVRALAVRLERTTVIETAGATEQAAHQPGVAARIITPDLAVGLPGKWRCTAVEAA